jgi:hypothetical protein
MTDAAALVQAFAAALEEDDDAETELVEHGPRVARIMLDWKVRCGDGRLERWTLGDLRELLLEWLPRADPETPAEAVAAFLGFLDEQGRLDAPVPLASLEAAVARLRPHYEAAARR